MKNQAKLRIGRSRGAELNKKPNARLRIVFLISLVLFAVMLVAPAPTLAYVSVSITIAPPPLPVYAQPLCPGPGFIWVPGYWAWDPDFGYYWIPGLWAPAPFIGALWTPGYWGWSNGVYIWNEGYWGPTVGFYGGINYGFGYTGYGYYGGYWSGGNYYYNRTVNNINVTNITNVYNKPVGNPNPKGVSFNGGRGGTTARPTSEQIAASRQQHYSMTSEQRHQVQAARSDPGQRVTANHGRPAVAATVRPGEFKGHGVVGASRLSAPYKAPSSGSPESREHGRPSKPSAPANQQPRRPEHTSPGYTRPEHAPAPGYTRPEHAPAPGYSRPEHAPAPRYPMGEPERVAPRGPGQGPERGYNQPHPQHPKPQPAGPQTKKENNPGEGREYR